MHDLVIRNGLIVDGSGKKPFIGDIAIDNENISLVSNSILDKGKEEIDAEGKLVTPGWVDTLRRTSLLGSLFNTIELAWSYYCCHGKLWSRLCPS